tara:strand:- start:874 stop:1281 length:408 start_codon:yes stop_codon:yes gene_type:complete
MCMGADSSKSDGGMTDSAKSMHRQNSPSTDDVGYVVGSAEKRKADSNSRRTNKSNETSFFSGSRSMISPVAASGKTDMTRITRASGSIGSGIATSLVPIKRPKMLKARNTISSLLSYSPTVKMFRAFKSRNDGMQ